MKNLKDYKFILIDMDGTLVRTASGRTFPKTEHDWMPILEMYDALKRNQPVHIHIVSNQGNMTGKRNKVDEEAWRLKAEYICKSLSYYTGASVSYDYCRTTDKDDPKRKPNSGMFDCFLRYMAHFYKVQVSPSDCIMVGDASGKPGQFSNSDLMFAKNSGIDYMDAADYIKHSLK